MSVRISATDWTDDGLTDDDAVGIARAFVDAGADIIHVSTGQTTTDAKPVYGRLWQTPYSDRIRNEARVPTIAEEDAKRPNRERDCLVGERTRIVNRIKSTLARLGIRNFKPTLRKAAERLATAHTPEGMPLPPNTLAELQRDMARLGFVVSQIRQIEEARQKR